MIIWIFFKANGVFTDWTAIRCKKSWKKWSGWRFIKRSRPVLWQNRFCRREKGKVWRCLCWPWRTSIMHREATGGKVLSVYKTEHQNTRLITKVQVWWQRNCRTWTYQNLISSIWYLLCRKNYKSSWSRHSLSFRTWCSYKVRGSIEFWQRHIYFKIWGMKTPYHTKAWSHMHRIIAHHFLHCKWASSNSLELILSSIRKALRFNEACTSRLDYLRNLIKTWIDLITIWRMSKRSWCTISVLGLFFSSQRCFYPNHVDEPDEVEQQISVSYCGSWQKFNSATFLRWESTLQVREAFLLIRVMTFVGYLNSVAIDRGLQFTSSEWEFFTHDTGSEVHALGVESHGCFGSGKRYHLYLQLIFQKVQKSMPNILDELALVFAGKACDDNAGSNELVPTLLNLVCFQGFLRGHNSYTRI